jgi:superfamily II RNA helicase
MNIKRFYLEKEGKCLDLYDENTLDVVGKLADFKEEIEQQDNLRKKQKTEQDKTKSKTKQKKTDADYQQKFVENFIKNGNKRNKKGGGLDIVQVLLKIELDKVILFFREKDNCEELKKQTQLIQNASIPYNKERIEKYIQDLYKLNTAFIKVRKERNP